MRKHIFKATLLGVIALYSMASFARDNSKSEEVKLKNKISVKTLVNEEFKQHISMIYEYYLNMATGFVQDDMGAVVAVALEIQKELILVNKTSEVLSNKAIWKTQYVVMTKSIETIVSTESIEEARASFAIMSVALFRSLDEYGVSEIPVYYQYCPMAFHGKGGYWLSNIETIQNPYFGEKMLNCGTTKAKLTPK